MRLTINLDHDHYVIAKALAKEAECSLSKAVNELIRKALEPEASPSGKRSAYAKDGLPKVKGKRAFTSEDVYRIENDSVTLDERDPA